MFNHKLVLVVEDDQVLRETIRTVIQDEGVDTAGASDGAEALRWLAATPEKPCLILLDLMMPMMDGWTFRVRQKADPQLAAICTAVMTANTVVQRSPIDADHFLWKPILLSRLLETVNRCCSG